MEKTIKVLGRDIKIAFNMGVQIAYEQITDAPFNPTDLELASRRMSLYYATIITNNPDCDIQPTDLLTEATSADIRALDVAVAEAMQEWYKIPAVVAETEQPSTDKKKVARSTRTRSMK